MFLDKFHVYCPANKYPQAGKIEIKDDRPADNISFAATNLVKPNLQSRNNGSPNGGVFPPTPPPENDKPRELPTRAASVRNGPKPMPPKLNIERARNQDRYEKAVSPQDGRPRGPSRSNTGASSRSYAPRARQTPIDEDEGYPDDVYDLYSSAGGRRSNAGSRRTQQRYIEEEDDEGSDYDGNSIDEGDFEMMNPRRGTGSMSAGGSSRGASRRPDVRKVRVKVHSDDVRYIMVGTAVEFPDLVDRIRDKFGMRRRFKIKIRDEDSPSEMITMADQDDLEMAMMSVKSQARRQKLEVGKLEVRTRHSSHSCSGHKANSTAGLDPGDQLIVKRWIATGNIPQQKMCSHDINDKYIFDYFSLNTVVIFLYYLGWI